MSARPREEGVGVGRLDRRVMPSKLYGRTVCALVMIHEAAHLTSPNEAIGITLVNHFTSMAPH
jgi:hypothetical protein